MLGRFIILFSIIATALCGSAQDTVRISLPDAIARARSRSVDAAVALNRLRSAYWQYRTYRAELLPEVGFTAKIPGYYKQYSSYQNADGTYSFVRNNYLNISGELSVSQKLWFSGGTVSLNTSLDFIRQLSDSKDNRFMAIPIALTLKQPIFGVNTVKWNRRIEPERYAEAVAAFMSETEEVAMATINNFFNVLMARENVEIAAQNLRNAEKLYEVAREKRAMGRISENDLLQMELNVLDSRSSLTSRESDLKSNMFRLRSFLDYEGDVEIVPILPEDVPGVEIVYADALDRALENNKFAKNVRRRQLEADYAVAQAKGQLRQIDLFAQVGYTGTGNRFRNAYDPLKDNQVVEIGFSIPILDWGKRRGQVKVAQSNRELMESQLRLETQNFSQDLFILVERFNNQQLQLDIANRADTIAQQRYDTNVETFMIGKISTLDLNDSQAKKDQSRQALVNELYLYWYYYYQIRSITLWNYATNTDITADIDLIIKGR